MELRCFLGGDESVLDQIQWADEAVREAEPARPHDRVAERHCPVMLDQEQRCGGVVRYVLEDVPGNFVGERVDAVGGGLSAQLGALFDALLALNLEADQRADLAAKLDRLLLREVAEVHDLYLSLRVLVDGERVDHAHGVALAELLQLFENLTVEVRVLEADHEQLNRSDGHLSVPPFVGRAVITPAVGSVYGRRRSSSG